MPRAWVLTDRHCAQQRMPTALAAWLQARGVVVDTLLAEDLVQAIGHPPGAASADALDAWAGLSPGDVVIARTRSRTALALLRYAERPGVHVLTPAAAIALVRDKPRTLQHLAAHGLPTPTTWIADSPAALRVLSPDCFPLLLRPHTGEGLRGTVLVHDHSDIDDTEWSDAIVIAQRFVDVGRVGLRVFVAGDTLWALHRPSPVQLTPVDMRLAERVEVWPELRAAALTCGRVLGLHCYSVDVVESGAGPLVVDVQDFPNYTGIDEAPEVMGALVAAALER